MKCKEHSWVTISRHGNWDYSVYRLSWCSVCGTLVHDTLFDGREREDWRKTPDNITEEPEPLSLKDFVSVETFKGNDPEHYTLIAKNKDLTISVDAFTDETTVVFTDKKSKKIMGFELPVLKEKPTT